MKNPNPSERAPRDFLFSQSTAQTFIEPAARTNFEDNNLVPLLIHRIGDTVFARLIFPKPLERAVERFAAIWVTAQHRQYVGRNKIPRLFGEAAEVFAYGRMKAERPGHVSAGRTPA